MCHAALPFLMRLPLSKITLIDGDTVTEKPLNRQWIFQKSDIGQYKVDILKKWLEQNSPSVEVITHPEFFPLEIEGIPDLVIDCTDRLNSKLEILLHCRDRNIPLIYAAAQRNHGAVAFLRKNSELFHWLVAQLEEKGAEEFLCDDEVSTSVLGVIGSHTAHLVSNFLNMREMLPVYSHFDGATATWETFIFDKTNSERKKNILLECSEVKLLIEKEGARIIHIGHHDFFEFSETDQLKELLKNSKSSVILTCETGIKASAAF
ncbi:MAG: HesA/MoeB/ThiF family protein, partial [Bacteroidota bacterium]